MIFCFQHSWNNMKKPLNILINNILITTGTKHFFDLLKYTKNWNHVTYKQTQLSIMTAAIMKPIFKKRLAKPFFDLFVIINFIHGVHMYLDPDFWLRHHKLTDPRHFYNILLNKVFYHERAWKRKYMAPHLWLGFFYFFLHLQHLQFFRNRWWVSFFWWFPWQCYWQIN